jgi:hypothetical protein
MRLEEGERRYVARHNRERVARRNRERGGERGVSVDAERGRERETREADRISDGDR